MSLINLLSKLISLPSHQVETQTGEYLKTILSEYGFEIITQEVFPQRFNIFAHKNANAQKKAVLFYGHLDTVPPLHEWSTACEPVIEDDRVIGLGSYDMKGGIVAFLEACRKTSAYVKVFLAVDEENISTGAWKAVEQKRDFFNDVQLVISAEPNFDLGLHGITRGRTGRFVFNATFKGKAAHIARYKNGVDAIHMAAAWIQKLYAVRENLLTSPQSVLQVRKIQAESVGISVSDEAHIDIEVLAGAGDTQEVIQKALTSIDESNKNITIELKPRLTPYLPGYFFETFPHQETIAHIIKDVTNQEMMLHQRSSVGDDNVLATLGIPVITWGPDGGNAHVTGEWVSISSLEKLSKMYRKLLEEL